MRRPSWVSSEVDLTRPSAARVYDFYLGGSHNLEVVLGLAPGLIPPPAQLPAGCQRMHHVNQDHLAEISGQLVQRHVVQKAGTEQDGLAPPGATWLRSRP